MPGNRPRSEFSASRLEGVVRATQAAAAAARRDVASNAAGAGARLTAIELRLDALEAIAADHEARITALEP